jgi:hypothetical protein
MAEKEDWPPLFPPVRHGWKPCTFKTRSVACFERARLPAVPSSEDQEKARPKELRGREQHRIPSFERREEPALSGAEGMGARLSVVYRRKSKASDEGPPHTGSA